MNTNIQIPKYRKHEEDNVGNETNGDRWDRGNMQQSLLEIVGHYNEAIREAFLDSGQHSSVGVLVNNDGDHQVVKPNHDVDSKEMAKIMNSIVSGDTYGVFMTLKCWSYMATPSDDRVQGRIKSGKLRVRNMPDAFEQEAIFVNIQTRDGLSVILANVIDTDMTGKPRLMEPFFVEQEGPKGTKINWPKKRA